MALVEFCTKDPVRLNNETDKTFEKCDEFYKMIRQVYEKWNLSLVAKITGLPDKDHHMAHLLDTLREDVQHIHQKEFVNK